MKTLASKRFNSRNQRKISIWNRIKKQNSCYFLKKGNRITQLHEENGQTPRRTAVGGEEAKERSENPRKQQKTKGWRTGLKNTETRKSPERK